MTRTNTFIALMAAFFVATQPIAAMNQNNANAPAPQAQSFLSKAWSTLTSSFVNTIVKPISAIISYCKDKVLSWFGWKKTGAANNQQASRQPVPGGQLHVHEPSVAMRIEPPQVPAVLVSVVQNEQPALHPTQAQVDTTVQEGGNDHNQDQNASGISVAPTTTAISATQVHGTRPNFISIIEQIRQAGTKKKQQSEREIELMREALRLRNRK